MICVEKQSREAPFQELSEKMKKMERERERRVRDTLTEEGNQLIHFLPMDCELQGLM